MKAIGIILAGGNNDRLGKLTDKRALPAVPVGSCYRALDFTLSNMSNSGIGKIAVITQYNSRSLHDHLSSAKWWDIGRKQGGLFIFTPYLSNDNSLWFQGTADSLYQNITFLKRSNEPYVVIASGNTVYKMNYNDVINFHIKTQADVTICTQKTTFEDARDYGVLQLDGEGRVMELEEKPLEPQSDIISTGVYIVSRALLIKLLETVNTEGRYDFVKDVLIRYRKKLKIMSFNFDGYWRAINSVKSYYNVNMDFLNEDIRKLFTLSEPFIKTKPKDEPSAKYNYSARATDCLVGSGCIINGVVRHSILFRKVFTGENTSIVDSIVMEGSYIGNNCVVDHAIIDKEVVLSDGKHVIGSADNPVIIAKGTVL